MMNNGIQRCHLYCRDCRQQITTTMTYFMHTFLLVLLLGVVNLPSGLTHIASILENDGIPGVSIKVLSRGPTVAPVPSPETIDHFQRMSKETAADDTYFNPTKAIKNLFSFSSSTNRLQGMKRVSKFHGNGDYQLLGSPVGTYYRPPYQTSWEYDDPVTNVMEDTEKPTFVPFIGARALTNIPEFFAHLKENLEALPRITDSDEQDQDMNDDNTGENDNEHDVGDRNSNNEYSKLAARRMRTDLMVDENSGHTSGGHASENWTPKQTWKPAAAGHIHYYQPKAELVDSQNILRRANNYNPAWLYTNLGLGKRRR